MTISFPMTPDVLGLQADITQNNDLFGGANAIYANRAIYVPQLSGQETDDYDAMVARTPTYILFPGVVEGFLGSAFIKPPVKIMPEYEGLDNIDLMGNDLDQFAPSIVKEVLKQGFCATMVDYSTEEKRPFFRFISPEAFISFRTSNESGHIKTSRFIFMETQERENTVNEFDTDYVDVYTVLDLDDEGNYRTRVYEDSGASTYTHMSTTYPKMDGKLMTEIPLVIHGVYANNFTISRSRLQDISDLNISVFQRCVDQVHMLHYTALPTPWTTGVDSNDEDAPSTIGPQQIWHISNPDANVGLLEFTGASARAHQDYIDNLKNIMASIGAQILKQEGISRETATSVLVRNNQQTVTISTIVQNISKQLERLLTLYLDWAGVALPDDFKYEINSDFVRVDMEPNQVIALVKAWMDGAISKRSIFDKFKTGEIVPSDRTYEQEQIYIEEGKSDRSELENKRLEAETETMLNPPDALRTGPAANDTAGRDLQTGTGTGDALSAKQV